MILRVKGKGGGVVVSAFTCGSLSQVVIEGISVTITLYSSLISLYAKFTSQTHYSDLV